MSNVRICKDPFTKIKRNVSNESKKNWKKFIGVPKTSKLNALRIFCTANRSHKAGQVLDGINMLVHKVKLCICI